MIKPSNFYKALKQNGVSFFTGVPDSLLKPFCAYVTQNTPEIDHVITANEGAAIGLAIGNYLATHEIPLVYLQNSGLGNTINPLMSLADKEVYGIPMLLLIGWRGEPGSSDEPQHIKQGRVMVDTLDACEIPYIVLDGSESEETNIANVINAIKLAKSNQSPVALIVKKGAFENYKMNKLKELKLPLTREEAIKVIANNARDSSVFVSTTGMASRELFEHRVFLREANSSDFLTVGGMGHASQIALGISQKKTNNQVFCIDGDGAALMHLGSLAVVGAHSKGKFIHILINNGAHDSVGGQPTIGFDINFVNIANATGYKYAKCVQDVDALTCEIIKIQEMNGPVFLEVRVRKGNRNDLGRPTSTPLENKSSFMNYLAEL